MANFKSDIALLQSSDDNRAPGRVATAGLFMLTAVYALLGTEAAGDTIEIGTVPQGATVIPELSTIFAEDPGTTLTATVGIAGAASDAYTYSLALDLSAGGVKTFLPSVPDHLPSKAAPENTPVYIKIVTASALTAGKKICVHLTMSAQN